MTPDQQKLCAQLRGLVTDCTTHDVDGKPCLTADGNVIELALIEIERLAGQTVSAAMNAPSEDLVALSISYLGNAMVPARPGRALEAMLREYSQANDESGIWETIALHVVESALTASRQRSAKFELLAPLLDHVTPAEISKSKEVLDGSCSAEMLIITAALRSLAEFCVEAADECAMDDSPFKAEEWEDRAQRYRDCLDACVKAWGGEELVDESQQGQAEVEVLRETLVKVKRSNEDLLGQIRSMKERSWQYKEEAEEAGSDGDEEIHSRVYCVLKELERLGTVFMANALSSGVSEQPEGIKLPPPVIINETMSREEPIGGAS